MLEACASGDGSVLGRGEREDLKKSAESVMSREGVLILRKGAPVISKGRKLKTRGTGADIDTNGVMASVTVWGREGEHAFKERRP